MCPFQKLLLQNRFRELKSSINVLESQESQKIQELKEIESTINKLTDSLGFIEEQRVTIKKLVERGIKSKYDLLLILDGDCLIHQNVLLIQLL